MVATHIHSERKDHPHAVLAVVSASMKLTSLACHYQLSRWPLPLEVSLGHWVIEIYTHGWKVVLLGRVGSVDGQNSTGTGPLGKKHGWDHTGLGAGQDIFWRKLRPPLSSANAVSRMVLTLLCFSKR